MFNDFKTCDFTNLENLLLNIATLICHSASAITATSAYIFYHYIPNIQQNMFIRFTSYLIMSNIIYSLSNVIDMIIVLTNSSLQFIQNFTYFTRIFGTISSVLWPFIFVANLYSILIKQKLNLQESKTTLITIGFVIPTIGAITWTSLSQSGFDDYEIFVYYSNIVIVVIIIIIPIYIKIIRASMIIFERDNFMTFFKQIAIYPILLVITILIPYTVFQISLLIEGCETLIFSWIYIIRYLQGFFDSLVFFPILKNRWNLYRNKRSNENENNQFSFDKLNDQSLYLDEDKNVI